VPPRPVPEEVGQIVDQLGGGSSGEHELIERTEEVPPVGPAEECCGRDGKRPGLGQEMLEVRPADRRRALPELLRAQQRPGVRRHDIGVEGPESRRGPDDGDEQPVGQSQKCLGQGHESGIVPGGGVEPVVLRPDMEIAQGADAQDVRHDLLRHVDPLVTEPAGDPHGKLEEGMPEGLEVRGLVRCQQRALPQDALEHAPHLRGHDVECCAQVPIDVELDAPAIEHRLVLPEEGKDRTSGA
jgi:hypothetical protein